MLYRNILSDDSGAIFWTGQIINQTTYEFKEDYMGTWLPIKL